MKNIADLIRELPDSPDGIAQFLADKGIKGVPYEPAGCPIARYLIAETNTRSPECILVSGTRISRAKVIDGILGWDRTPIPPDSPVTDFLAKFDNREYPELLRDDA